MLVITRKKGESVHIGSEIELTILDVRNGRARIGILCPREIAILRREVIGRERRIREPDLGGLNSQDGQQLQAPEEQ